MTAKIQYLLYIVVIVLAVVFFLIGRIVGSSNSEQALAALIFGTFISLISVAFFLRGAYRFRENAKTDKAIRLAYRLSCGGLVIGLLQIPLWYIFITPNMHLTDTEAGIAFGSIILSLFGPAIPWLVYFLRYIRGRK